MNLREAYKPASVLFAGALSACASVPEGANLKANSAGPAIYRGDKILGGSGVPDHFASTGDWRRSELTATLARHQKENLDSLTLTLPDGSGQRMSWNQAVVWAKSSGDPVQVLNNVNELINHNYKYSSTGRHPKGAPYLYTPAEILGGRGEPLCRDYTFAKVTMLGEAGWPADNLFYTSLKAIPSDPDYHTVAVVRIPGTLTDYALDLRTDTHLIKLEPGAGGYDPLGVMKRPVDAVTSMSTIAKRPAGVPGTARFSAFTTYGITGNN